MLVKLRWSQEKSITKKVQVVSGLTQGDSIVVAGVSRLRDGMKVDLVNELSTGSEGDE